MQHTYSNAAPESLAGRLRGADVYFYRTSYEGGRAAEIIAQHYKTIYPVPSLVRALATTTLAEVRLTRAPAVLMEVGYHDNAEDEAWIRGNIRPIAVNLVQGLCRFFNIPFVESAAPREGVVVTQESPLLMRSRPSMDAEVIAHIPRGARVMVYGEVDGWFVVSYQGREGYASAQFIELL